MLRISVKNVLTQILADLKSLPELTGANHHLKPDSAPVPEQAEAACQDTLANLLVGHANGHAKFLPSRTWAWFTDELSWDQINGEAPSLEGPSQTAPPIIESR